MALDSTQVVGGPLTVIVSATTIGHTENGAIIRTAARYNEIRTHESGEAVVGVYQQGGRDFTVEVTECEISLAALARVFNDLTVTNQQVVWSTAKANQVVSGKVVRLIQTDQAGNPREWYYPAMVPMADAMDIECRNADGSKWIMNAKWRNLYNDTQTGAMSASGYACISGIV